MAIPHGSQAALNHSRPSLVLMRQSPLTSPHQGHVLIGFSFMGLSSENGRDKPSGGKHCGNAQEDSGGFTRAKDCGHCDECHGGDDEERGLHVINR